MDTPWNLHVQYRKQNAQNYMPFQSAESRLAFTVDEWVKDRPNEGIIKPINRSLRPIMPAGLVHLLETRDLSYEEYQMLQYSLYTLKHMVRINHIFHSEVPLKKYKKSWIKAYSRSKRYGWRVLIGRLNEDTARYISGYLLFYDF